MTTAVAAPPTLGYLVRAWLSWHLPSPRDERRRIELAAWQKARILRWYELTPEWKRAFNRCHDEDPKGKGKSPMGAAIDVVEFRGPVVFSGLAEPGQYYDCLDHGCSCGWGYEYEPGEPMGVTWGSPGLPAPWVQVVAVSEKQTANTWAALDYFLSANEGRLAKQLRLDAGRTLVYWKDRDDAKIERVTSSAGSRTGQPITHATMDEPQEWTPSLRGPSLARTVLANLTKLDGWAHFTGNAPVLGMGSVSEMLGYAFDEQTRSWAEVETPRVLQLRPRPPLRPREEMTRDELRPLVQSVYEGTPWTPVERILDDASDRTAYPWSETLRLFLNVPADIGLADAWMPADLWDDAAGTVVMNRRQPTFVVVRVSHDHRTAAIAAAQRQGEMVAVTSRVIDSPSDGYVSIAAVEQAIHDLRRTLPAPVMAAVRFSPRGKEYIRSRPGPEIACHGAFLEGVAQRLRAAGAVVVDVPNSAERVTPAAEAVMERLTAGGLIHNDDPPTTAHILAVVAKPAPKGWSVGAADGPDEGASQPIVAAQALMLAVHRAMTAPKMPSRKVTGLP